MTSIIPMIPYFLNANIALPAEVRERSNLFFPAIFNNTGNSYITYGMVRQMGLGMASVHASNSFASLSQAAVDPVECARINHGFSHVFLTLQDHLREDFTDTFYENAIATLERLTLPLVVYSLGANSMRGYDTELHRKLSPLKKRFFAVVAERCKSIGIRGEYTASVLESLGVRNYAITGCPSFFEQGSARRVEKKSWNVESALVGATGNYTHPDTKRLYYLLQDELIVSKLRYFSDMPTVQDLSHFSSPMLRDPVYRDGVMQALARGNIGLFADMDAWRETIRSKLHFVIGSRLHGAIMGLNAGVPAIVTNGDARATETCALLHIPQFPYSSQLPKRLQDIYDSIDTDAINAPYAKLYAQFQEWMAANNIKHKDPALILDGTQAPALLQSCSLAEQLLRKQRVDAMLKDSPHWGISCLQRLKILASMAKRKISRMPMAAFL